MTAVNVGASVIWLFVFVYAVLGAIDFGSSFWRFYFLRKGQWPAASMAEAYVSPTWELINSFLILIPVTLTGLFPGATFAYGSVLLVPATLLLILIALRGAYWQFGYASQSDKSRPVAVVGLTGLVLPGVFLTLLPLSQGGYVIRVAGAFKMDLLHFFTSPEVYLFIAFGITLSLYLSSLFLVRYSFLGREASAYASFRRVALVLGPLSMILGVFALYVPHPGLAFATQVMRWWPLALVSFISFAVSLVALWLPVETGNMRGAPRTALMSALVQLATADAGYGLAHRGYWLYPYVTFKQAASSHAMFVPTMIVLIVGTAVLLPGLLWFRRLFITNNQYVREHVKVR